MRKPINNHGTIRVENGEFIIPFDLIQGYAYRCDAEALGSMTLVVMCLDDTHADLANDLRNASHTGAIRHLPKPVEPLRVRKDEPE